MGSGDKDLFGSVTVSLSPQTTSASAVDDTPFHIAVLGDFGARPSQGSAPIEVDRDNFERILDELGVQVEVEVRPNTRPVHFGFRSLDDFHPDHLLGNDLFLPLRELRERLLNPATFPEAAQQLQSLAAQGGLQVPSAEEVPRKKNEPPATPNDQPPPPGGNLLDRTLEATTHEQPQTQRSPEQDEVQRMMRDLMRPYVVPAADPQQQELVALADAIISRLMSRILHAPQFQALESAWRGVRFLLRGLETGAELKLFLIDCPKDRLATDLLAGNDLTRSRVYQQLVQQTVGTPGGQPWAVVLGNYTFDATVQDIQLLGRIAKLSAAAGAPFIAAGHSHLAGCPSLPDTPDPHDWRLEFDPSVDQAWQQLRQLAEARFLGLVLPRFLMRTPYGKNGDPVESFDYEELTEPPRHDDYLWGNGAFACGALIGVAFLREGWGLRPDAYRQLIDLPIHVSQVAGRLGTGPCAEAWLTDQAGDALLSKGLMPLMSIKNRDAAMLGRFRSVSASSAALAGRWNG